MKTFSFVIFVTMLWMNCFAQSVDQASPQFIFLPSGLHFAPLRANIQEPRIGVFKFLDDSNMKVDIGNTIDVFGLNFTDSDITFTAGIDFMAYALTTGAQGLRLQIDAIDGFFGGNLSFSKELEHGKLQGRLRLLHHSAHLVDGHYQMETKTWIDNREPIPFTRDFGEFVLAHSMQHAFGNLRCYGGVSYATLVRPIEVQRVAYLAGAEIYFDGIIGSIESQPTNIYCAYNISMLGIPTYTATNAVQIGLKFGKWYQKGPSIYIAYYTGRHMLAEYYDQKIQTIGAGFTVDFF